MNSSGQGYYHHPSVQDDQVVFICEDDLWSTTLAGGIPRRLTNNLGRISSQRLSPDLEYLAFCGREEGQPDVYLMPAQGGHMTRLTFLGTVFKILGWSKDSQNIIFLSSHETKMPMGHPQVFSVSIRGEYPRPFLVCPTLNVALQPDGPGIAIGRNNDDNARWKRYRGGEAGEIWIDRQGNGSFEKLELPQGNPNGPMWIGDRLYFVSDHDGIGNLYSCDLQGKDLRRETEHVDFYVRHPATDGRTIVYQAGADLYKYEVETRGSRRLEIEWRSSRVQTQRKFASPARYLYNYHLHPQGHEIAITARGKMFSMAHWEGAPIQCGPRSDARHRIVRWTHDGARLVAISDQEGIEEKLVVFRRNASEKPERVHSLMPGRVQLLVPSPAADVAVIATSRLDLWLIEIDSGNRRLLDHNQYHEIRGLAFSPDGRWVAYRKPISEDLRAIFLCELATGAVHQVTRPLLDDFSPNFDPDGKFLYFLSRRVLNPVNDSIQFAVSFPATIKPYLITLRKDITNPFIPKPSAPGEENNNHNDQNKNSKSSSTVPAPERQEVTIDLEGIEHRMIEFPVREGLYKQVMGIKEKVVFTTFPVTGRGDLGDFSASMANEPRGALWQYDFNTHKLELIASDVSNIQVANESKTLAYRSGSRLRVFKAGEKPGENGYYGANRKTGWIDLNRIKCSIEPLTEWRQMFREAWRLQREFFWTEDMSGVDWNRVYNQYLPLLDRVATRSEFSDLVWEMQGELGTSHAYEIGGDYRHPPYYTIGKLGADFEFDAANNRYLIKRIYRGDVWMKGCSSPLCAPGLNVQEGDALLGIGGLSLSATVSPGHLLANHAGHEVEITIQGSDHRSAPRQITVKTLPREFTLRYREWVEQNAEHVEAATDGQIGYLHIPDMGTLGLIEFHRYFLAQTSKQGLIIDVRYNGGGNVSSILLEKLLRRPLGFDVRRWGKPDPYPKHAIQGPLVAITNEFAGSDGDIFCHSFKMLEVGPLIGKRTWGGVIGIDSRYTLADGGRTTQPQYSFWFKDVKWKVENYGVDPDIEVDFDPGAFLRNEDPQLDRAIQEAMKLLEHEDSLRLDFDDRPNLNAQK